MSETKTIKNPSPLVLAVLSLDEHFAELKKLSARIDEIDIKSDFDIKQTEKLINQFAESSQAVSSDIQTFVAVLNEAREQAESAAQKVSIKGEELKIRKDEIQEKMTRFQTLVERVGQLNQILVQFKPPAGEALSEQDRAALKARLTEIGTQLDDLIDEAETFKGIGHESKIKILEQNADSMSQSLVAVSKKINEMMTFQ